MRQALGAIAKQVRVAAREREQALFRDGFLEWYA